MNHGPLIFLAAFFALASSWCGFVLTPQLQLGHLQQTNTLGSAATPYPIAPAGQARQGLEVYRANGCASCHSQQVGQTGTIVEVALLEAGGSDSPETLLAPLGVDFHDPAFWQKGFDEIRALVDRAESLADTLAGAPEIGRDRAAL